MNVYLPYVALIVGILFGYSIGHTRGTLRERHKHFEENMKHMRYNLAVTAAHEIEDPLKRIQLVKEIGKQHLEGL